MPSNNYKAFSRKTTQQKKQTKMTRLDPIIAVKDVAASAAWYQQTLGLRRTHGGDHFAVMQADDGEIVLCLHKWGEHGHPTMTTPGPDPANGLILYFRSTDLAAARHRAAEAGSIIEDDIHQNPNSLKQEFSLRDPDGYFVIVSEFHEYEG